MAKSARPWNFVGVSPRVFLTGEISPSEILNFKNQKRSDFEGFQFLRSERKLPDLDIGFSEI